MFDAADFTTTVRTMVAANDLAARRAEARRQLHALLRRAAGRVVIVGLAFALAGFVLEQMPVFAVYHGR